MLAPSLCLLPDEVLRRIALSLDHDAVQRLQRTSRRLFNIVEPQRHKFARAPVELSLGIDKKQADVLQIAVRRSPNGFRRLMNFRVSAERQTELRAQPIGAWLKYKSLQKDEAIRVSSFLDAFTEYLPKIFTHCNPLYLSVYQCPSELIILLAEYLTKYNCKVCVLDLNCGKANRRSVHRLLNSQAPRKLTFRAESRKYVTRATYGSKAFRSATSLDVMIFRKDQDFRHALPASSLISIRAPFHSTNVAFELESDVVRSLICEFLARQRDFDSTLGWNIPGRTHSLDADEIFAGLRYSTKTLLNHEQEPCGRIYEFQRGRKRIQKLRLMWTAQSLLINGVLFSLRDSVDFIDD